MAAIHALQRRRARGELPLELRLEARRLGELIEAAPILRAGEFAGGRFGMVKLAFHRWQPEQLCGGLMFQSCTNFSPILRCSSGLEACQSRFVTWSRGRR